MQVGRSLSGMLLNTFAFLPVEIKTYQGAVAFFSQTGLCPLSWLHNLDINRFTNKFLETKTTADISVDANANVDETLIDIK